MAKFPPRPFDFYNPASRRGRDTLNEMAFHAYTLERRLAEIERVLVQEQKRRPASAPPQSILLAMLREDGSHIYEGDPADGSGNRWRWEWDEFGPLLVGDQVVWDILPDGRNSEIHGDAMAYNGIEFTNDGAEWESAGINVEEGFYLPDSCVKVRELRGGIVVLMFEVPCPDGLNRYWFSTPNEGRPYCECPDETFPSSQPPRVADPRFLPFATTATKPAIPGSGTGQTGGGGGHGGNMGGDGPGIGSS